MSLRLADEWEGDWQDRARCRGQDEAVFFPFSNRTELVDRAKAICAHCPVVEQCREECDHVEGSTALPLLFGIFGMETPTERWRRRTGKPVPVRKPKPLVLRGRIPVKRPHVPMPRNGCQHRDHTAGHCWDCGEEI